MRITTKYTTNPNSGAGKIVAKAAGKQRTVQYDPAKSRETNHAAAAGALAKVLMTDEQRAKVLHPSGAQRVRNKETAPGTRVWTFTV